MRGRIMSLGVLIAFVMLAVGCAQTDVGLTTKVKTKLAADDTVKAYKIDVDTKDAVVTLTGSVESEAAHTQAVHLARTTEGVKDVVDNLRTEPASAATSGTEPPMVKEPLPPPLEPGLPGAIAGDAAITSAVKAKLLIDKDVAGLRIDVDTKDSVVTLTGKVKSDVEKAEALRVARGTDGVKSVIDKLTIERQ